MNFTFCYFFLKHEPRNKDKELYDKEKQYTEIYYIVTFFS